MAQEVVWLPSARDDLRSIYEFIAAQSEAYATNVVARILRTASSISDFPTIGRQVPEWEDPLIRERFVFSFRIIYRLEPDRIIIMAVIHGARLLPDDVRDRST